MGLSSDFQLEELTEDEAGGEIAAHCPSHGSHGYVAVEDGSRDTRPAARHDE